MGLRRNPPGLRVVIGQNYVPKLFTPYCTLLFYSFKYLIKRNLFQQHQTSKTDFEVPLNSTKSLKRRELLPIACTLNFIFSGSDKKLLYQNYLHLIANFCVTASNILSKEIFSNNTKHQKQISNFPLNSTESLKDDFTKWLHVRICL